MLIVGEIRRKHKTYSGSRRRKLLGIVVAEPTGDTRYYRTRSVRWLKTCLNPYSREDSWYLLNNAKLFLVSRIPSLSLCKQLDKRRDWNVEQRPLETVLDLFPSLKYAHSSFLPVAHRRGYVELKISVPVEKKYFNGVSSVDNFVDSSNSTDNKKTFKSKVRVDDIARSHNYRLDPVDAPKELRKYQIRIARVIAYAYEIGCVPIMVTLTSYHRWHALKGLVDVLQKARSQLFDGRQGRRLAKEMGLSGYLNRLEETINDGDENTHNSGWHPHYHCLFIIPRDNLEKVSGMEQELRERWVSLVCKYFKEEFGEEIPESYLPAFKEHGLWFSRYSKGDFKGQLRPVKDSQYLAKIMGYDPADIYGGDKELATANLKDSKIPFDLLREYTASNVDLWNEYAIAMKGVVGFRFSKGLEKAAADYFDAHPSKNPFSDECPDEEVLARLDNAVYQLFYRNYKIPQFLQKAKEGVASLKKWMQETFVELGFPHLCVDPLAMPHAPDDDSFVYSTRRLNIDTLHEL